MRRAVRCGGQAGELMLTHLTIDVFSGIGRGGVLNSSTGWRNWRLGMIFGIKGAGVEAGMIFFVFLCGIFRAILVWTIEIASMHFGLI